MSLDIHHRERDGITILELKGRIVLGPEATAFREAMHAITGIPEVRIILNMTDVAYVDSTGLGALVLCAGAVGKSKGAMKLVGMNRRNLELLVTAKLEAIFETYTEEQDAINSFFPDRAVKKFDILAFVREQQAKD